MLRHSSDFDAMSERNLDAHGQYLLLFRQKTMLSLLGIIARIAIAVGMAFILSKTVPSIPNKWVYRFVFLFVVGVPFNFVVNYVNVRLLGYHEMGWGGASVISLFIALFFATFGTFLGTATGTTRKKISLAGITVGNRR